MATNSNPFENMLGDYKTYIIGGIGIIVNVLAQFNIWNPTSEQLNSINGMLVMAAAIFLRAGVKKAQTAIDVKATEVKAVVKSAAAAEAAKQG